MMKGQFFIISSVIMVYIIILTFQYLSSFNDVSASRGSQTQSLLYISYVKNALNQTVYSSLLSGDCSRLDADLNYTKNFLRNELMERGLNLTVFYIVDCGTQNARFNFTIKDDSISSFTNFTYR